jgi:hypothetical protein
MADGMLWLGVHRFDSEGRIQGSSGTASDLHATRTLLDCSERKRYRGSRDFASNLQESDKPSAGGRSNA